MPRSKRITPVELPARGLRERAGEPVVCLTAYIPPRLARSVKVRAATEGRTLSSIVTAALELAERATG